MAELLDQWRAVVGPSDEARAAGDALLTRWSEPHRHYHDVAHLEAVLAAISDLADDADDVDAVRLAAWFHDAVYEGRAGDDEEASARLAEEILPALGVPAERAAEVARLVRLTTTHEPAPGDRNGAVLCDADLSVLGGDPQSYATYASAIRAEYRHVPDELFRVGRSDVLQRLLAHDPLYRTATALDLWEHRARRNLQTELTLLRATGVRASGDAGPPR